MPTQLDQLIAYLDRPGVTELVLCAGRPIALVTNKGTLMVTARPLGGDQLTALVRGTPLEAMIADNEVGADAVRLELGNRPISVQLVRKGDDVTVRIQAESGAKPRSPRTTTKSRSSPRAKPATAESKRGDSKPPATARQSTPPRTKTVHLAPLELRPPAAVALPEFPPALTIEDPVELSPPPPPSEPQGPPVLELELAPPGANLLDVSTPKKPATGKMLRIDVSNPRGDVQIKAESTARPAPPPPKPDPAVLAALGLPPTITETLAHEHGLVLIAAAPGHGKTRTIAALAQLVDRSRARDAVTIDQLRDRESIELALTAAESGYLVLATIEAASARDAIERLLDPFPGMTHNRVKTRIATTLRALIAKRLPPTPTEIVVGPELRKMLD